MADRWEVIRAVASQTVTFDAVDGRPSATPSVTVKTSGGSTLTASTTTGGALESVSTTLSGAAAAGDTTVTVASASGITVGKSYLLTNTWGQKERVRVVGVNSTTIHLDEQLRFAHATASTFVSTRFVYTLATDDVATLSELNTITAAATVGGVAVRLVETYDVVLHPLPNLLTVDGLKARWPDLPAQEYSEQAGEDYARQRTVAWEKVKRDLRRQGFRPALLVTLPDLEDWGYAQLALDLQESGIQVIRGVEPISAIETLERRLGTARTAAVKSLKWVDLDEDDAASTDERATARLDFLR